MSREINTLIRLIESSMNEEIDSNGFRPFNTELALSGYTPDSFGIAKEFLKPKSTVLVKFSGDPVEYAEEYIVLPSRSKMPNFSYQPTREINKLNKDASSREQGPVYQTKNVGSELTGDKAYQRYLADNRIGEVVVRAKSSTVSRYRLRINSNNFQKAMVTRNKKKYKVIYTLGILIDEEGIKEPCQIIFKIIPAKMQ